MDSITNTASDFVSTFGGTWDGTNPLVVAVPFAVLAFSAWVVEQRRKYGTSMGHALAEELLPAYKWLSEMRRFAPEVLALALVGLVSSILVCTGKHMGAPIPESDQVWQVITREWPILMTADTLLGLQAMFRPVFLLSAACRAGAGHSAPLTKEAAAFMLLAATMRVILLALSPADVFYLDGPLGGKLNLAVEVLAVPLLLYLAQSVLRDGYRSGCMFACGTLCALWLAHCHQLHVQTQRTGTWICFSHSVICLNSVQQWQCFFELQHCGSHQRSVMLHLQVSSMHACRCSSSCLRISCCLLSQCRWNFPLS